MKLDDLKQSNRVEDRRGQSGPSFGRGPSGGNGMNGLLLQLLFSRGKGKWFIIAILIFSFFVGGGNLGDLIGLNSPQTNYEKNYTPSTVSDEDAVFISKVFASTEEFWTQEFKKEGLRYNPPTLVIYDHQTQTGGCGVGSASAGPFYCPADSKVYQGLSDKAANALTVRLELQADYYAGAWANYVEGQGLLEVGDIEEAMNAAYAVGDDTLQEAAYGTTVPDSFTHGTSEQRQKWFMRGFQYGDLRHGDTFSGNI